VYFYSSLFSAKSHIAIAVRPQTQESGQLTGKWAGKYLRKAQKKKH
jgi:hypothetical protein